MLPTIPLLIEHQQIAGDVDHRLSGKVLLQGLDQVDHVVSVDFRFRHGLSVPGRILDLTGPWTVWGRCHESSLLSLSSLAYPGANATNL